MRSHPLPGEYAPGRSVQRFAGVLPVTRWVRFRHHGGVGFGTPEYDAIHVHEGDMFAGAHATGATYPLHAVQLLMPCVPGKMLGMWRNYHQLCQKTNAPVPVDPLYFIKANNSFLDPLAIIRQPHGFEGTVVFEGELGVVIGKTATAVSEQDALACIFGYTCVNDVTATEPLDDAVFPHWTRAKGFDTFGPFGPCIQTVLDWQNASVKTRLNGVERQNYPLGDMVMSPQMLVSRISFDMTLVPGDIIALGTSLGVGRLKPGSVVEIEVDGIGTLTNHYEACA